jgi:hypothetical protein
MVKVMMTLTIIIIIIMELFIHYPGGVDIQIRFLLYHILTIILRDNLEGVLRQIEPHFEDDINDDEDLFEGLSRWL